MNILYFDVLSEVINSKAPRVVKKPEERKNELLDIAIRLFLQKGYEKTSVKDIYKEAKGSFGMFYHHFKSKEEIFITAMKKISNLFTEKLSAIMLDKTIPYEERFNSAIKHWLEFLDYFGRFDEYKPFGKIDSSVFRELNSIIVPETIHPIELYIEEGVKKGIIQTENTHLSAVFIAYGLFGNIHEEAKCTSRRSVNIEPLLTELSGLLFKFLNADPSLFTAKKH